MPMGKLQFVIPYEKLKELKVKRTKNNTHRKTKTRKKTIKKTKRRKKTKRKNENELINDEEDKKDKKKWIRCRI